MLLDTLLRVTVVIAVVCTVVAVPWFVVEQIWLGVATGAVAAGTLWALVSARSLRYVHRAWGAVVHYWLVGFGLLLALGPIALGPAWMVLACVLATVLLDRWAGVVCISANVGAVLAVALVLVGGGMGWRGWGPEHSLGAWALVSLSLIGSSVIGVVAVGAMVGALHRALEEQRSGHVERQRIEAERSRLAAAIEQAAAHIAITDLDGRIDYVNSAMAVGAGVTRRAAHGMPLTELAEIVVEGATETSLAPVMARRERWAGRVRCRLARGAAYDAEATVTPLRDTGGAPTHFLIALRDVTREAQLERQLQQAEKLEAIGTLAGGLAHDLNNLLVPIITYTELVSEGLPADNRLKADVGEILVAADRARDLVRRILRFSRPSALERHPMDLARVVFETVDLVRATSPASLELVTRIDPEAGVVIAEAVEVQQIVLNLLTNATQAVQDAGQVQIALRPVFPNAAEDPRLEQGRRYLKLTVSDDGPGIHDATLRRIFEPFFTTKPVGVGTGLGLATVHRLIDDLGGVVRVASVQGHGTSFDVYLPAVDLVARTFADERDYGGVLRGARVLVVDDDEAGRSACRRLLSHLGVQVSAAESGEDALRWLQEGTRAVDLVLTDLDMTGKSGIQLAVDLQGFTAPPPVVLMSGRLLDADRASAERAGIAACLEKPLRAAELGRAIAGALSASGSGARP